MRLGSSILGGKPMRIPGIVDVYQVGDEWVARSWPKVQNQPNSAAQLYWRKRFKDAHAVVKSMTGKCLDAWRNIQCPPGKMWIDIAIHSALLGTLDTAGPLSNINLNARLAYDPNGVPYYGTKYCLFAEQDSWFGQSLRWWTPPAKGSNWPDTMKWNDLGWTCPKGKRPKIKWGLSIQDPTKYYVSYKWDYWGTNRTARRLVEEFPDGAVIIGLDKWIDPVTGQHEYSLWQPPIYLQPEPPPWWMYQ